MVVVVLSSLEGAITSRPFAKDRDASGGGLFSVAHVPLEDILIETDEPRSVTLNELLCWVVVVTDRL